MEEENQIMEETQVQNNIPAPSEQKNTVGAVGMRFSIIGLIALITIILAGIWFPLLFIWFILWIIGLFYKPRGKARVAVCIPLVVFIAIASISYYIWNSVKAPFNEFMEWAEPQFEQLENNESFDGERFGDILEAELNSMTNGKSEDERKALFESSTGSNSLEKGAYMLSSMFKEWFKNALEKYNSWELPEVNDDNQITVDVNIENDEDENTNEEPEDINENIDRENVEVFSQSEQNDIEQILNILE